MEALQVLVRVRPLTEDECEREEQSIVSVSKQDPQLVAVRCSKVQGVTRNKRPSSSTGNRDDTSGRTEDSAKHVKNYTLQCKYDKVFGQHTSQQSIYESLSHQIDAVLNGVNCTVFAYGQTGTGKTYSMFGKEQVVDDQVRLLYSNMEYEQWGLVPRMLQRLFRELSDEEEPSHRRGIVHCSYVQIYREQVHDLMQHPRKRTALKIRENVRGKFGKRETFVQGLSEFRVSNFEDVVALIERGNLNRAVRATEYNKVSSRSHAILQLDIQIEVTQADGSKIIRHAKLNFVDLAGCEKWNTHREISNSRSKELTAINNSLSALGNVIQALGERKRLHVPYRDSKLTRLLQDSLGGNTKTALICTLSPCKSAQDEVVSTLQFADRAKRVMVRVQNNEIVDDSVLLARAQAEIVRLKRKLRQCTCGSAKSIVPETDDTQLTELLVLRSTVQSLEKENRRLVLECVNLKAELGKITGVTPKSVGKSLPSFSAQDNPVIAQATTTDTNSGLIGRVRKTEPEHASCTTPAQQQRRSLNDMQSHLDQKYSSMDETQSSLTDSQQPQQHNSNSVKSMSDELYHSNENDTTNQENGKVGDEEEFLVSHSVPPPSDIAQALREYLAETEAEFPVDDWSQDTENLVKMEEDKCYAEIEKEQQRLNDIQKQRRDLVLLKSSLECSTKPPGREALYQPSTTSFNSGTRSPQSTRSGPASPTAHVHASTTGPIVKSPAPQQLTSIEVSKRPMTAPGDMRRVAAAGAPNSKLRGSLIASEQNQVKQETTNTKKTSTAANSDTSAQIALNNWANTSESQDTTVSQNTQNITSETVEGMQNHDEVESKEDLVPTLPAKMQYSLKDVGRSIEIYQFRTESWYPTVIVDYDPDSEMHRIKYSDGTISWHRLEGKRYRFIENHDNVAAGYNKDLLSLTKSMAVRKLRAKANTRRQRKKEHAIDTLHIKSSKKGKGKSLVIDNAVLDAYLGMGKKRASNKHHLLPSVHADGTTGENTKREKPVLKRQARKRSLIASLTDPAQ